MFLHTAMIESDGLRMTRFFLSSRKAQRWIEERRAALRYNAPVWPQAVLAFRKPSFRRSQLHILDPQYI